MGWRKIEETVHRVREEGLKTHPLILSHGTSQAMDTEDTFFTSARVTDQVYARRRALKERRKGARGRPAIPEVEGEVEWVATTDANRNDLCLLMVNTKSKPVTIELTAKGREFAAPTYVTLSCPGKYVDCREIPGDGKTWKQMSWEDTQTGYAVVPIEMNEGLVPPADSLAISIEPHTVQAVYVMTRKRR